MGSIADKKRHSYRPALAVRESYLEYATLATVKVLIQGRNLPVVSKLRYSDGSIILVESLLLHDQKANLVSPSVFVVILKYFLGRELLRIIVAVLGDRFMRVSLAEPTT